MALFRKLFYRKPPDGLLEISERLYVFDCCSTTATLEDEEYKKYFGGISGHLQNYLPNASFMVVNFREGDSQSQVAKILSEYDMTVMEYPRHYEGCPLLTMEMVHHFLKSSENWLLLGQQNVLLMHCERGGWPVLAFMLAALLIYRKQYTAEQKTLDMIYKLAPRELLQLISPLNPFPSQLRYLQYISSRDLGTQWPPLSRALRLDCIVIRFIPDMDGKGGCRPIVRIYGPDPLHLADQSPKVLFSTPKNSKTLRHCMQANCDLLKIDINCYIQGDVVLECLSLDDDLDREHMIFRVMFHTSFIRSNILTLNRDELDTLSNIKDCFPKDFRTEVMFSEMDIATSLASVKLPGFVEKEGIPVEAFARVQELFSNADWLDQKTDAPVNVFKRLRASDILQEVGTELPLCSKKGTELSGSAPEKIKNKPKASNKVRDPVSTDQFKKFSFIPSLEANTIDQKCAPKDLEIALQRPAQSKIISPRVHGSIISSPTTSQASPMSMSRYQNSSSPLGITALLQDHVSPGTQEDSHPKTLSAASVTSSPAIITTSRPVHMNALMNPSISTPPPPLSQSVACTTPGITSISLNNISSLSKPLQLKNLPIQPLLLSPLSTQYVQEVSDKETAISAAIDAFSLLSSKTTHSSDIQDDKAPVSLVPSPGKISPPTMESQYPLPPKTVFHGTLSSYSVGKSSSEPPIQGPSPLLSDGILTPSNPSLPSSTSASSYVQLLLKPDPTPLAPGIPSSATCLGSSPMSTGITTSSTGPSPPLCPPPPPLSFGPGSHSTMSAPTPPLPSTPGITSSNTGSVAPPVPSGNTLMSSALSPPIPPPPPPPSRRWISSVPGSGSSTISVPPLPPLYFTPKSSLSIASVPPVPTQPAPSAKESPGSNSVSQSNSIHKNDTVPPVPGPPSSGILIAKGQGLARPNSRSQVQSKRNNLKPYHWLKLTRAVQGSLWAEAQKSDEAIKAPEFDMKELESLFSAAVPSSEHGSTGGKSSHRVAGHKPDKIQLVELRRANNCEIMLTKVKIPIPDLMSSVLALDDTMLDGDQVVNLIKFCPTKEEIELLKGYKGEKENLGKCEQFFLELMKVPRVESKLRVFAFKIQYSSQVSDLKANLNVVNSASEEIRNSMKLKRIMQTILSLGNALNHGTARGSAIGFRLDSLLKLTDTRARNNKLTLMHYLCKVLAEKLPELLDFPKDLVSLELANKVQLKYLAEEMQAITKGLEKVVEELTASENDGPVSENFCKTLKEFLGYAEAEVRSLASLYSYVGRSADALALYFGEDPVRCPFEQVVSTLSNFVRLFIRAHEENCKQLEFEKKKARKNAENGKVKMGAPSMETEHLIRSPIRSSNS